VRERKEEEEESARQILQYQYRFRKDFNPPIFTANASPHPIAMPFTTILSDGIV
jgi:hypothetical protein